MQIDETKFFEKLDGITTDQVYANIAKKVYGDRQMPLVLEYLRRKAQQSQEADKARQREIQESANRAAWWHVTLTAAAVVISVAAYFDWKPF